jgi:hypothetical protein
MMATPARGYTTAKRPFTIANAATDSGEIDCRGMIPSKLFMPAAFTGATVSFKAAQGSAGTFNVVNKDDGTLYTATVAANAVVDLDSNVLNGLDFIKVVSASSELAERSLVMGFVM